MNPAPPGWKSNPSRTTKRTRLTCFAALFAAILFVYGGHTFSFDGTIARASTAAALFLVSAVFMTFGSERRWFRNPYLIALSFLPGAIASLLVTAESLIHLANEPYSLNISGFVFVMSVALWAGSASDEVLASAQFLRRQFDKSRSVWKSFLGMPTKPRPGEPIELRDLLRRPARNRGKL